MRERLRHVLEAGQAILAYCDGKTFDDYMNYRMMRSAVEREFTIIGEALREASRVAPEIPEAVTDYRRIVDFRNILVHDYATVYDEGVWRIIHEHLPRLLAEVRALLGPPPA